MNVGCSASVCGAFSSYCEAADTQNLRTDSQDEWIHGENYRILKITANRIIQQDYYQ